MESKTARLTILVDSVKKKIFEELYATQDLPPLASDHAAHEKLYGIPLRRIQY